MLLIATPMPTSFWLPMVVGKEVTKICRLIYPQAKWILKFCLSKANSADMRGSFVYLKSI